MKEREDHEYHPRRTNGDRSPEELQEDIQRHRDNLDQTLSALGNKLSPGELLDEGLRYMKSGPGEFFANLAQTAKHNPVPVALTGIGLAWLMLGQRSSGASQGAVSSGRPPQHQDVTDLYAGYLSQEYPFAEDEIDCIIYDDLGARAYEDWRSRAESGSGIRAKAEQWKSGVDAAMDSAGGKASELREEARARIERARQRMTAAGDEVRQRAGHARDVAWHRAEQAGAATAAQARRAMHATGELVERYPLSVLAIGVAAGAALGTALPETRREDRLLGETADALKEQAGSAFNEQAQRVRHAVGAARDAAVDEAQAQGLTGEGLRQEARELQERAGKVAGAAREEAQRQGFTAEGTREDLERAREKVERVGAAARDAAREGDERER